MSIATNLVYLAAEESIEIAIEEAQKIQSALEQLSMVGSKTEVTAANFLLTSVNQGVEQIYEGTLVTKV